MRVPLARLSLLALLLPAAALAQSPADRAGLLAWRDTLDATGTIDQLAPLEPKGGKGVVGISRQAVWQFRVAQLGTDRGPFDNTLITVDRALLSDDKSAFAWYVMGLVRESMWNRRYTAKPTARQHAGLTYRDAAIDAYVRAIKADSSFIPASTSLAGMINAMGPRVLPPEPLPGLRLASSAPVVPPDVHLAIALLENGVKRYDAALDAINSYLRLGGNRGIGRLYTARMLSALGRHDEAIAAYDDGLTDADSTGIAAYRADLAWIADEWELNQLDSLSVAEAPKWIRRFFREREALELRAPGERVKEHLRRWVYVHQNFLIYKPDDVPVNSAGSDMRDMRSTFDYDAVRGVVRASVIMGLTEGIPRLATYLRTQWEIDDRGVLYMRHGEPAKRVSSVAGPPNESWSYSLPEGVRVFHFLGSRHLGTNAGTTLVASLPMDPDMLSARSDLDSRYAGLAQRIEGMISAQTILAKRTDVDPSNSFGGVGNHVVQREVVQNQKAIAMGVSTDGFPLVFKRSLEAVVQVYGVGFGAGESRRLLTVFAVPGRMITPKPRPDGGPGMLYPISVRLIAMDRERTIIRQLDTTRVFLTRDTLKGDQYLSGLLELPVPPGMYQVRALVTSPGLDAGASASRDSVNIPPTSADLLLSDFILGREGSIAWTYTGQKVTLNPLNAFPLGANAELFYEAGGLVPGSTYEVGLSIRKGDDKPKSKAAVEVVNSFRAEAPYQQMRHGVGLAQLKPGSYWMTVTFMEKGSERVTSRRQIVNILEK